MEHRTPSPTISLALMIGLTDSDFHQTPAYKPYEHQLWMENKVSGVSGFSLPRMVTKQLIKIQHKAMRYITAKKVKHYNSALSLTMGLNTRLGATSFVRALDVELVNLICLYL
jgi:hypothetical protein